MKRASEDSITDVAIVGYDWRVGTARDAQGVAALVDHWRTSLELALGTSQIHS